MKPEITCLKIDGPSMPYFIAKILAVNSIRIYQEKTKRAKIKGDDYEGVIECHYLPTSLNELSGISFSAIINYNLPSAWGGGSHTSQAHYLIQRSLLEVDLSKGFAFNLIDPNSN